MTSEVTKQKVASFSSEGSSRLTQDTVFEFRNLTRRYALFHMVFLLLFLSELFALLLFLPFLSKSLLLAALVAATFLTAFTYFVLRFYFQTKKPEQFLLLREEFIKKCSHGVASNANSESGLGVLRAIYELIHSLEGQENQYYRVPSALEALAPLVEKFSVWCHFGDVQIMKELLHTYCIRAQLQWIKAHPTNLDLHVSLANSYIAFYKIYQIPAEAYAFIAKEFSAPEIRHKFQKNALCAIEELKIILHYKPQDLWALSHLGAIYHDLDRKEDERNTYEALLQIAPQENKARFRLGLLYFQLGLTAQGLKIYEELSKMHDSKAQELIEHYDLFHSQT